MRRALFASMGLVATLSACSLLPGRVPTWPPTPVPSGSNATSAPVAPSPATTSSPLASAVPTATPDPFEIERAQLVVIEAVNTDPENFGGVYLEKNGTLVILYVGSNAGGARVEALIEPGVAVQWRQVERSQADLMRILHEIRSRNLDGVVAISRDDVNNRVEVLVSPSRYLPEVSSELDELYGDAVTVVTGPPPIVH